MDLDKAQWGVSQGFQYCQDLNAVLQPLQPGSCTLRGRVKQELKNKMTF